MRTRLLAAVACSAALVLAGCGGERIGESGGGAGAAAGGGNCGTVNIALNPWVGYTSNAYVIGTLAQEQLGCTVVYKELKEEVAWQGMGSGEVDAVVENWGHDDLRAKYIDGQKTAVSAGSTGVKGVIGWYVPPWMAAQYPDITDWNNLNKYAEMFKTSESGDKGQLLDGDPSYVTNDEALVKNLNLDFKVVTGGSEAALIQSFRQAEAQKTPLLAYFYEPQWFFNEMKLVKVNLPPYTPGCDADPAKIACDYPPYDLDKIVSKRLADANGPGYQLIKNFQWTAEDQNTVSLMISEQKMKPEDAAKKWIADNEATWQAWIPKA